MMMRGENMGGPGASERAFYKAQKERNDLKQKIEGWNAETIKEAKDGHTQRFNEATRIARLIAERVVENGEPEAEAMKARAADIVERFTKRAEDLALALERGDLNGHGEDAPSDPLGTELYTALSKEMTKEYTAELTALANELLAGDYNWENAEARKVELSLV